LEVTPFLAGRGLFRFFLTFDVRVLLLCSFFLLTFARIARKTPSDAESRSYLRSGLLFSLLSPRAPAWREMTNRVVTPLLPPQFSLWTGLSSSGLESHRLRFYFSPELISPRARTAFFFFLSALYFFSAAPSATHSPFYVFFFLSCHTETNSLFSCTHFNKEYVPSSFCSELIYESPPPPPPPPPNRVASFFSASFRNTASCMSFGTLPFLPFTRHASTAPLLYELSCLENSPRVPLSPPISTRASPKDRPSFWPFLGLYFYPEVSLSGQLFFICFPITAPYAVSHPSLRATRIGPFMFFSAFPPSGDEPTPRCTTKQVPLLSAARAER